MSQTKTATVRQRQRPSRQLDLARTEGTIEVSRLAYGRETEVHERIRVPVFGAVTPARVRVEGSVTKNLGDYNSARVAVCIELPCYPVETEIRAAYQYASELLDEMIPVELEKAVTPAEAPPVDRS